MKTLLLVLCEYGACTGPSHTGPSHTTHYIQDKQHETYRLKWCHTQDKIINIDVIKHITS